MSDVIGYTLRTRARCYCPTIESEPAFDMNRSSKMQLAVAVALMAFGSSALASPTSEWQYIGDFQAATSKAGLATNAFQSAAGLGTHFDSSSWDAGASHARSASALTLDAQTAAAASDASTASADERRRALSNAVDTSNTSPVVGSPAALELTLWNFINSIRAQQVSNPFVQLQTASANIDYTINSVPAPVPLPPALWLFAGGLAALAIGRFLLRCKPSSGSTRALATT